MRVISYEIHNVLRASDIKLDLEGRNLFLVGGKTAQGKTSALRALLMALCGRSGMDDYPEVALRNGADKGWVKVKLSGDEELHELDGLTVELLLKRRRSGEVVEEFRILDSSGEEAPEPRTLLKRLYDLKGFDPLAFDRSSKKERRDILMRLTGLDFSKQDKERKKLYDERTSVNRDIVRLAAQVDAMPFHEDAPAELVSIDAAMEEVESRSRTNRENQKARQELLTRQSLLDTAKKQEADLQERIRKLQAELDAIVESKEDAETRLAEQQAVVAGLVDADVEGAKLAVKNVTAINEKVVANRRKKSAGSEVQKMRGESVKLSELIEYIDTMKTEAIAKAKFPVDGMSFDEDGVLLNGLPYEQASHRERIMSSIDVGIALNPKLRLFVCQDGGALDVETIEALDKKLADTGYQMLCEMVTRFAQDESLCAVVIRDGMVAEPTSEPEAVSA
jgi:flagellar motility protein MotE (MotC chaperone)